MDQQPNPAPNEEDLALGEKLSYLKRFRGFGITTRYKDLVILNKARCLEYHRRVLIVLAFDGERVSNRVVVGTVPRLVGAMGLISRSVRKEL